MRLRPVLVGLLIVPVVLAADAAAPPQGWKEYSPKDGSFAVWLPEKSNRRSERERTMTIRGKRIKVNLIHVESGGLTFEASTLTLPAAMARQIPQGQRLEIIRDVFVGEVNGKVSEEMDVKEGAASGKDYTIDTPRGAARLRAFARGGRLYRASVQGTKDQVTSKAADTFLDSFKLSGKAPDAADAPAEKKEKGKADTTTEKGKADAGGAAWVADSAKMTVPDAPAAGKLLGADFQVDKAHLNPIGVLFLEKGDSEGQVLIFLNIKRDEKLDDKTFKINARGPGSQRAPHVHVKRKYAPGETSKDTAYTGGYAMLLEFGKEKDGTAPGKIYLCLPDGDKSVIAGTFMVKRD